MRSRRKSKRVLASPEGKIMVGIEFPSIDDNTSLLREGPVMVFSTPTSVSDRSSTDTPRFGTPEIAPLMDFNVPRSLGTDTQTDLQLPDFV
ncbi:hypothetical protein AVEN_109624-1 [Araneus ventricosus]|uniref:Uncharacterized protein n=1 Tax=Araneus ventricosus TaxID=182803 RepID=A0A4Y2FQK2_ARAVE|nr:hypothetical protein AVEN_109624-1 [Araneus ventricosus]